MKTKTIIILVVLFSFLLTQPFMITSVNAEPNPQKLTVEVSGLPLGSQLFISDDVSLTEARPAVAYNSTNKEYLVVWYNDRPGNDDIRAQRLTNDGQRIGSEFYISAGSGRNCNYPDVAYDLNKNQYLVVWEDNLENEILGRRVSGTGLLLDTEDIIIRETPANSSAYRPAVVYSSFHHQFLVVWDELSIVTVPVPKVTYNIHGQIVTDQGLMAGTLLVISQDDGFGNWRVNSDVAVFSYFTTNYFVVWQQRDPSQDRYKIRGQMIDGSGGFSGSSFTIIEGLGNATIPKVACVPTAPDNYRFLVTWQWNLGEDNDIYARPVSFNGTPGTAMIIANSTRSETNPAIAGSVTAGAYLIAWQDSWVSVPQNGFSFLGPAVIGSEVSVDGVRGSTLTIGAVDTDYPAIASSWAGEFLTVFERTITGTLSGIWGRLWGPLLKNIYLPLILNYR